MPFDLQSPIETERVRKVIIYFYLEDDSIHIAEARSENSGLPQVQYSIGGEKSDGDFYVRVWGLNFFMRFLGQMVRVYVGVRGEVFCECSC